MNCVPLSVVTQVLQSAMSTAGVAAESQQAVLRAVDATRYLTGTIIGLETRANAARVFISGTDPAGQPGSMALSFPPNADAMLAECKRAQNEDRALSVAVTTADPSIVISLLVYGSSADPASNKRSR